MCISTLLGRNRGSGNSPPAITLKKFGGAARLGQPSSLITPTFATLLRSRLAFLRQEMDAEIIRLVHSPD